jgi:hypothetical protein
MTDEGAVLIAAAIRRVGGRVHGLQTGHGLIELRFELPEGVTCEQLAAALGEEAA